MNTAATDFNRTASSWWAARRLRYNVILLFAAPISSICFLVVGWLFESRLPCLEITLPSLLFGTILFLVGLGLANLCYFLGPLSESLLHPNNLPAFRRTAFTLGTGFSLVLIFFPVIGNLIAAAFGSSVGVQCE